MKVSRIVLTSLLSIIGGVVFSQELLTTQTSNCSETYLETLRLKKREVFNVVENPPYYGQCEVLVDTKENSYTCSDQNVLNFLKDSGIVGSVENISETLQVRFIVELSGCISNILVESNNTDFDNDEVIDAFRQMKMWQPGRQGVKKVRVWRTVDVNALALNN